MSHLIHMYYRFSSMPFYVTICILARLCEANRPRARYGKPFRQGSLVDHHFLNAQCLGSILQHVSLWRLGRYAVTDCYKRYPSKIKYKIKIIEIDLKIQVFFICLNYNRFY